MDVSWPGLPPAWAGARLVQLSDLHFRRPPGPLEEEARRRIADIRPDLLLFTGDAIISPSHWTHAMAWLASLEGPSLRFAVPGNWDYRGGARPADMERRFREAGWKLLVNASCRLEREGQALHLAGLDDVRRGRPDPVRAYRDIPPDAFNIALCHNPDILRTWKNPPFHLLLCGHTHGGQVRLPGFGALYTSTRFWKKFEAGLYNLAEGRHLYVNRGLGRIGLAVRLFCPPEVTVLTLHRAPPHGSS